MPFEDEVEIREDLLFDIFFDEPGSALLF